VTDNNNQSNHNVPAGSSSVLVEIEYKFPFRRHRLRPERLWVSTPLRPDSVDASMSTTIDTAYIRTHCCCRITVPNKAT
jgi:hypothetical protein